MRSFKCHVRIKIDNSELGVIGDFTTINALESLRLRLRDPNIANRCKISYNPSLVVVYFYNKLKGETIQTSHGRLLSLINFN